MQNYYFQNNPAEMKKVQPNYTLGTQPQPFSFDNNHSYNNAIVENPKTLHLTDPIKIAIVGDPGVGVRSLHLRLIDGVFVSKARKFEFRIPTESMLHDVTINNKKYQLIIYDSCTRKSINPSLDTQQEQYFAKVCFSEARAILLCYSPDVPGSFQNLGSWLKLITEKISSNVVIYILQLKTDLKPVPNPFPGHMQNMADPNEGKRYAESLGLPFFEVSALTGGGIKELFNSIIKDVDDARQNISFGQTFPTSSSMHPLDIQMTMSMPANYALPAANGLSTPEKFSMLRSATEFEEKMRSSFKNSPSSTSTKKISVHARELSRHNGDSDVTFN